LWPALAFLLAGVPLAALLDRLGFFEAVVSAVAGRERDTPVLAMWVIAALTTIVLNLDTTVVLLTPLYLRFAKRADTDAMPLVLIPLLLASFASSVLPVSNLTNLIVVDQLHVGVGDFLTHLALPSIAASAVGWLAYRRLHPTRVPSPPSARLDRHALLVGGAIVVGLLVGFVFGPTFGIAPWMTALAADIVLIGLTRVVPWRDVPLVTAAAVAVLGVVVAVVAPSDALHHFVSHEQPLALVGIASAGAVSANLVNNLPALLAVVDGAHRATWGIWAWLLGVNVAAVALPIGALANLLWLRILRAEGIHVRLRCYVRATMPVALPAFAAAVVVLAIERVVAG
jgi:arsenical pump membrane protein